MKRARPGSKSRPLSPREDTSAAAEADDSGSASRGSADSGKDRMHGEHHRSESALKQTSRTDSENERG